jgi:tRNA G26 N,N-dimethylase Trm1
MKGKPAIMIDVKKAMLDPTMVFKDPNEVVASDELTRDLKIEILRRWEYDAHQLEVAEEEAGMGVRRPEILDQVIQALHTLGAERDTEHTPPTK